MKFTIILLLLLTCFTIKAQCPTEEIFINSQDEMNQFSIDYPDCTELETSIFISGNVTSLYELENVNSINGSLTIDGCSDLTSVDGLVLLKQISNGHLIISNNPILANLEGLRQLKTTSVDLIIENNPSLFFCKYEFICQAIDLIPEIEVTILNNGQECNSLEGSQTICNFDHFGIPFTRIEASLSNDYAVNLTFSTSDIFDQKYEAEHTINFATPFNVIGTLDYIETKNGYTYLNYSHPNPNLGSNYYRIKTTMDNGSIQYSQVAWVFATSDSNSIIVYPNPAIDKIQVRGPENNSYTICDSTGAIKYRGIITSHNTIDLSSLESGLFFIYFENGMASKFVKI